MDSTTRARRHAAVSGLAAVVLFAVGNALWGLEMPEDGTAIPEVLDFYDETADRIVIGGSLSLLSIAAGVWFAGAFRQVLIDEGADEFLASIAFAGLLLGLAAGLVAEGTNTVAGFRAQDDELTPELGQALFEISQMFGAPAGGVGFGVAAIAIALAALRSGAVLSRRVAMVTLAVGVALLSPLAHANFLTGTAMLVLFALIVTGLLRRSPTVDP
jgi:hypothetical protein